MKLSANIRFVILLLFMGLNTYSQSTKKAAITGKVIENKTTQPLEFVAIALLTATDSAVVMNAVTGKEGTFKLNNVANGNYVLKVSYVGYKTFKRALIVAKDASQDVGTIILEAGLTLKDVAVQGDPIAVKVKTDTTEFNAAAFKAAPDATVEDGLKKLPGVEVDKDGNIKSNGEAITKVTVDGKEFFGNDPKIATKNLPHDAVKSYRIIQDKSDKAKDTGIDDGKRTQTLDIVLKDDKKKGWFGSGSIAGGTDARYLGSLSANRFTQDKQFNVLMLSNNVNQTGFTSEEANNFSGGGGGSMMMSSNGVITQSVGGVNVGSSNQGLTKTNSGGVNFSDAWGKKNQIKFSGSYFGAYNSTDQETETNRQTTQLSGLFFDKSLVNNANDNLTNRINVRITGTLDSLTSLTFTPNINFGFRNGNNFNVFAKSDGDNKLINSGSGETDNESDNFSLNGSLRVTRKFHKKKGSISFDVYQNNNSSVSDNINHSVNTFYQTGKAAININRSEGQESGYGSTSVSTTINRVVSKDRVTSVFITPSYSSSRNTSDRNVLEFNPVNGIYELRLDSLSNNSRTTNNQFETSFGINRSAKKWNLYFTGSIRTTNQKGFISGSKGNDYVSKSYLNVLPDLSATYRPKPTFSIRANVYAYVSPPSVSYLFATQNNSNPLYISLNNPGLKPTKTLASSVTFNTSNTAKKTYLNFYLNYSRTLDAISRSSYLNKETGITVSKPLNVNGNYRFSASGSFIIPTKIAGLRIGPGLNFSNSRNVNFIDGALNNSDQTGAGANFNINYSYKDALIIGVNNSTTYTHLNNSARTTLNNNFWGLNNGANLNFEPIKKWRLLADFTNRSYAGQSFVLLNAGIQKFFMDKNKLSLELRGFDLLNNNKDVYRYASDISITDTRSNSIGQYFYLKLVYRVNKVGASPSRPAAPTMMIIR